MTLTRVVPYSFSLTSQCPLLSCVALRSSLLLGVMVLIAVGIFRTGDALREFAPTQHLFTHHPVMMRCYNRLHRDYYDPKMIAYSLLAPNEVKDAIYLDRRVRCMEGGTHQYVEMTFYPHRYLQVEQERGNFQRKHCRSDLFDVTDTFSGRGYHDLSC